VDEWQRAATPKGKKWPWGKAGKKPFANLRDAGKGSPQNVGSYPKDKSAAGCMDVIGNVAEWCNKGAKFYSCGGSWLMYQSNFKPASPTPVPVTARSNQIGFRCVRDTK